MDETQQRLLAPGVRGGRPAAWGGCFDGVAARAWGGGAPRAGAGAGPLAGVFAGTCLGASARSARGYDPEQGSLWLWLWGIARNHTAVHFRRRQRDQRVSHLQLNLAAMNGRLRKWLEGAEDAPVDPLEASELADLVRATLAR